MKTIAVLKQVILSVVLVTSVSSVAYGLNHAEQSKTIVHGSKTSKVIPPVKIPVSHVVSGRYVVSGRVCMATTGPAQHTTVPVCRDLTR